MSLVKFISGDGVEHEVEETSMAATIMRQNGFQQINDAGDPVEPSTQEAENETSSADDAPPAAPATETAAKAKTATPKAPKPKVPSAKKK
ncbi:MAG TPA: hypothetical protein VGO43_13635 [Pyrinomonadaceae bacterium]|jgi:hypothetical protein|nr:hypothetical protein [Pyrinomonadaceae bacterium]